MKTLSSYHCRACGTPSSKWSGQCGRCGEWNTLIERATDHVAPTSLASLLDLGDVEHRWESGLGEFDRVLGGGLVAGSSTLLYGEPGVGKSTLSLAVAMGVARTQRRVIFVCAEESPVHVARRARRLGEVTGQLDVVATSDVNECVSAVTSGVDLCVIDSISALRDVELAAPSGSVPQVRRVAELVCATARASRTALVMVGHVTKDGELAGPRALEHLVDIVVRVEGDRRESLRIVRALKNRFGTTEEIGLFEMTETGMIESDGPIGLRDQSTSVPGVVTTVTNDGSRGFVVDIQALLAKAVASPRRVAHRVSAQRLALMLAVLEARAGVESQWADVFATTSGGLSASEPSADAALALAVASAARGFVVPRDCVVLGEVGLSGEIRPIAGLAARLREASRRGLRRAIVPAGSAVEPVPGLVIRPVSTLLELLEVAPGRE